MEVTRDLIFAMAAKQLRQDFVALSVVPHRGLKGDEATRLVRELLNSHLPKRFAAGAGFIIDQRDEISKQTDVVVYDAFNCPVYRASTEAAIFPANNVAAVVEVKSVLDKDRLREAWENIAATKRLAKDMEPEPPPFSAQTLGCVFAFESRLEIKTLEEHYASLFRERGLGHHIDAILVLDKVLMTLASWTRGETNWSPVIVESIGTMHEGRHFGIGTQELGENSLDGWLRLLLWKLAVFRSFVDHPGRLIRGKPGSVLYTFSLCFEQEPELRAQRLREYRDEAQAKLREMRLPPT